jgi:Tol biopolymer transport system component
MQYTAMKHTVMSALLVMVVLLAGCARQDTSVQPELHANITALIEENGGRVDWGKNGIAHSRYGEDKYYDVWVMDEDGSDAHCLTCSRSEIPQLHNGQPAWHPSGDYIVFQSQDPLLPHTPREDYMVTQPGHGKHNNLWITDSDGETFYQLTSIKENRSILHPHFSHDGKTLLWSEKIGDGPLDWAIMIADFVETPNLHLENVTSYQPVGNVWYETHDFSPDDTKILVTVGTEHEYSGFDIWEMELETQTMHQLTDNPDQWDEHAHYSPDGKKIVWASSHGYEYDPKKWVETLKTDLWIMDCDGSNKERLTYFNEHGHHEYMGYPVIVADNSWSPDGQRLAVTVGTTSRKDCKIAIVEVGYLNKNLQYLNKNLQKVSWAGNSYTERRLHPQGDCAIILVMISSFQSIEMVPNKRVENITF